MSERMTTEPTAKTRTSKRRSPVSQGDVPSLPLEKARRVATAITENYAADPTRPLDVASALNVSPTSGPFRLLCGAALGYGLTDGGPNATRIGLTPLGRRLETPTEVGEDAAALKEPAQTPTVAAKFYAKYDGSALPPRNIAENVLAGFDVPRDRAAEVYDLLITNAEYAGLIKTIKDKKYIDTSGTPTALQTPADVIDAAADDEPAVPTTGDEATPSPAPPTAESTRPKNAIFIGHGGKRGPMEQLVKILNEYSIPHKQAVAEPNQGRPIPQKVADVMRDCDAAILVFTADKEYFDKGTATASGRPVRTFSHELGAASVLYGDRIVIFKERGIELPSNFSSVGYIEFEPDKLEDKGIELFRELVSMRIVSISVG